MFSGTLLFASDDVLTALVAGRQPADPHPRQDMVGLTERTFVTCLVGKPTCLASLERRKHASITVKGLDRLPTDC